MSRSIDAKQPAPLRDVRVLDLSRLVAGNILTHILADFGAEVVKVEPKEGDALREWLIGGQPTHWSTYCRNKKSLCVDFRAAEGVPLVLRLVSSADVFVENFRPGTLEKMGLSTEKLLEVNPKLVIVRISGFGQDGPYSKRPGFGTLIEAMSGFAAINGFPDREPVLPPIALADNIAGLYGAAATLIALRNVETGGGKGQVIDLPLFDPLFAMLGPSAADYQVTGRPKPRAGSRSVDTSAPRNTYRTRDDKWIALSAAMQGTAERLFREIGMPELIADPRYATNTARSENIESLDAILAGYFVRFDREELLARLTSADVTVAPVMEIGDILNDPHVQARRIVTEMPCGTLAHNITPRLSETPGIISAAAPALGQHTREILAAAGISDKEISKLVASNVVRTGEGAHP